jgi:2'-5' RNA ligase
LSARQAARLVVVIFPVTSDASAVERFRAHWDPLAQMLAAHITLVFPFQTHASADALKQAIAHLAYRHAEFPIEFADPAIWDREYLFLLARKGGEQIRQIHLDLYDTLSDAHTTANFLPHMTIGRNGNRRELERARLHARAHNLCVRGQARQLSLYRVDQYGGRHVLFSVALRATGAARR